MAEAIRLVIWDLDETFWDGTLTEGGIKEYLRENHDIVIELARRGILSSICSKNSFDDAMSILLREGIADYFVFPSISWDPKGQRVAQIVDATQLRPATIMFIDDNPNNRGEVQAIVPEIQVEDETFIPRMLADPRFKGKEDSQLSRLTQYKLLEKRKLDEKQVSGSNEDFLRSCDVRVMIDYDVETNIDRAVELINRTNQLNFTKNRLPENIDQARKLLRESLSSSFDVIGGLVRVADRYGDYGYIGFFLRIGIRNFVDGEITQARLQHFCFSCRTIGMQIERWVYQHIGSPEVRQVGEVLSDLSESREIDWIRLVDNFDDLEIEDKTIAPQIILHGGCETTVLSLYLQQYAPRFDVHGTYTANGIFVNGNLAAYVNNIPQRDPIDFVEECAALGLSPQAEMGDVFDESCHGALFVANFGADAGGTFRIRHKTRGWIFQVSADGLGCHLPAPAEELLHRMDDNPSYFTSARRAETLRVNKHFADQYDRIPSSSDEGRAAEIRAIAARIPPGSKFILIVPHDRERWNGTIEERPEFTKYGDLVRRVIAEIPYAGTVSISDILDGDDDILNVNHYSRAAYARLAEEIAAVAVTLAPRCGERLAPRAPIDRARLQARLTPAPISFDFSSGEIDVLLGRGWATPEQDGRWMIGDYSELRIPWDRIGLRKIRVQLYVSYIFHDLEVPSQELIVSDGTNQLLRTRLNKHGETLEVVIQPGYQDRAAGQPEGMLTLLHPDARSPKEMKRNEDSRRLSLMIREMKIEVAV